MNPWKLIDYAVAAGLSVAIFIDLIAMSLAVAVKTIRRIAAKEK